jgi:hypothetical protein
MKVGDLIKLKAGEEPRNGRDVGTVLDFDAYIGSLGVEPMASVLWDTGKSGWILTDRIEVISESNSN